MQVEAGGELGSKISKPENKTSEMLGIAVAMLILVTEMVLPIAVAIFGLVCGLSIVSLLGHVVAVPDVAPTVATMIGLVGINYSLFIVTRARSARHDGMSVPDAIGHAASTSGSAVAFAGGTVVIALLALAVSGISLITVLGQASAIGGVIGGAALATILTAATIAVSPASEADKAREDGKQLGEAVSQPLQRPELGRRRRRARRPRGRQRHPRPRRRRRRRPGRRPAGRARPRRRRVRRHQH